MEIIVLTKFTAIEFPIKFLQTKFKFYELDIQAEIQKHYNFDTLNQNYNTREIYINVTFNVN